MKNDRNDCPECSRRAGLSRREVLTGSSALTAAALFASQAKASPRIFFGPRSGVQRDVLVQIFLRGAMDGLTTVVPYGDPDLYLARPNLAVAPPGQTNGAVDLDGFFGLAPAAAPLLTPYSNGHLAFVHASGSTDPTRSHFEGFARMEFGDPGLPLGTVNDGWIARYLIQTSGLATGELRGVQAGDILPFTLSGAPDVLPIPDFANFKFPGHRAQQRIDALSQLYSARPAPVGPAAASTFASIALMGTIDFAGYVPAGGAQYPDNLLAIQLRDTAALIKADVGVEVVTLDVQGWDLHASLGPIDGEMANLLDYLSKAIEAFYLDLGPTIDRVVLVVISEFGRHVEENSSLGTDHGHGNAMMVMGGHINGGQVLTDWPGLAPAQLDMGDVAVTIDYRDILGEILQVRLGASDLSAIFPQHTFTTHGITV